MAKIFSKVHDIFCISVNNAIKQKSSFIVVTRIQILFVICAMNYRGSNLLFGTFVSASLLLQLRNFITAKFVLSLCVLIVVSVFTFNWPLSCSRSYSLRQRKIDLRLSVFRTKKKYRKNFYVKFQFNTINGKSSFSLQLLLCGK